MNSKNCFLPGKIPLIEKVLNLTLCFTSLKIHWDFIWGEYMGYQLFYKELEEK